MLATAHVLSTKPNGGYMTPIPSRGTLLIVSSELVIDDELRELICVGAWLQIAHNQAMKECQNNRYIVALNTEFEAWDVGQQTGLRFEAHVADQELNTRGHIVFLYEPPDVEADADEDGSEIHIDQSLEDTQEMEISLQDTHLQPMSESVVKDPESFKDAWIPNWNVIN